MKYVSANRLRKRVGGELLLHSVADWPKVRLNVLKGPDEKVRRQTNPRPNWGWIFPVKVEL